MSWKVTYFDINAPQHIDYLYVCFKSKSYFARKMWGHFLPKGIFFRVKKSEELDLQNKDDFIILIK